MHYEIASMFVDNEIQLAGYKILNALWIIGTQGTQFVDRYDRGDACPSPRSPPLF